MTHTTPTPNATQSTEARPLCAYCGAERPVSELQPVTIWRNYRQVEALYCTDKPCAQYAQMAAEG